MNAKFISLVVAIVTVTSAAVFVCAQPSDTATERILGFNSDIEISVDGSMTVTETITVNCLGSEIRHGIYRDFPTRYKDRLGNRLKVDCTVKRVLRDGLQEGYHLQPLNNGIRVYMGRKEVMLSPGEYTYTLQYSTNRQLGFFKDFDELYWNVTGNGWVFPIEKASATVRLPRRLSEESLTMDGYTGYAGATEKNFSASTDMDGSVHFSTTAPLLPKQGLTIALGWPKGIVSEPTFKEKANYFFRDNRVALIGLLGILAVCGYYLLVWYLFGRDPSKGTVIPLYNPPEGFSPAACRFISKMTFDHKVFTCAVINMAVKGFLVIQENRGIYTLKKTGQKEELLSVEEARAASALFSRREEIILQNTSHEQIRQAIQIAQKTLAGVYEKSYFLTNKSFFLSGLIISAAVIAACALAESFIALPALIFISLWLTFWTVAVTALLISVFSSWKEFIGNTSGSAITSGGLFIKALMVSILSLPFVGGEIMGIIFLIFFGSVSLAVILGLLVGANFLFYYLLKAPTLLGRKTLDQIEGFKMYLSVAEKDRLNLLNPPEKSPELFERYLPYALALDVQQQWSQQFSSLLQGASRGSAYRPGWYSGSAVGLSAGAFASSLGSSFSDSISSASHPPGSSSGGSGGGSSGGGGGGGGGGGW